MTRRLKFVRNEKTSNPHFYSNVAIYGKKMFWALEGLYKHLLGLIFKGGENASKSTPLRKLTKKLYFKPRLQNNFCRQIEDPWGLPQSLAWLNFLMRFFQTPQLSKWEQGGPQIQTWEGGISKVKNSLNHGGGFRGAFPN